MSIGNIILSFRGRLNRKPFWAAVLIALDVQRLRDRDWPGWFTQIGPFPVLGAVGRCR
jgi:uncharacterized membrane protein YhaH (DUF805 family)